MSQNIISDRARLIAVIALGIAIIVMGGLVISTFVNKAADIQGIDTQSNIQQTQSLVPQEVEQQYEQVIQDRQGQFANKTNEEMIAEMTLQEKLSQMIVVERKYTEDVLSEYPFAGIVYYNGDLTKPESVKQMLMQDDARCDYPLLMAIDEEGGYVSRISGSLEKDAQNRFALPGTTALHPMFSYKDDGTQVAFDNAATLAENLRSYGFNWDFAPVADIADNDESDAVTRSRSYSDDYQTGALLVASAIEGFHSVKNENGTDAVLTCLKHFPGLGGVLGDSHRNSIEKDKTLEQMRQQELSVFQAGIDAGADSVMLGHVAVKDVDDNLASSSSKWIEILRRDLHFNGVIITDSLIMREVMRNEDPSNMCLDSIRAGCDMLLAPENPVHVVDMLCEAVKRGEISEAQIDESVNRILEMKRKAGLI